MEGSTQHQNDGDYTQQELARARGKYRTLFIVKCLLGILLLVLGGVAVKNTSGQTDTFGPPYFLGAFIVGCAMVLAGLMNIIMYRNFTSSDSATLQKLSQYTCFEVLLTGIAIVGGFIGIFFVSLFGIPECEPTDFFSHCNYTKNLSTNRNLAIAILISLLVSEIIAVVSIVINCRTCKGLGPYNMLKGRQPRFTTHQNVYVAGGAGNVVMTTAPQPSPYAGGFGRNRNYDSYSADTQIIIDGNVIDKTPGGFSGAVIHPPTSATVIHPPVGYTQYSGATNQNTPYRHEGQGHTSDDSVNHLQEQNRLLREQIALQQQQLQLMQQQQQQQQDASSSSLLPPPPSYDTCLQDPAQMKFLQEQNEELQNRYQSQQQQITEKIPLTDNRNTTPSAPPM